MTPIYLLVGVPGSGKSWVCEQLTDLCEYVAHDHYQGGGYVEAILDVAGQADRPVLIEAPFSISAINDPLETEGCEVVPVFLLEDEDVLRDRYEAREGKPIPKGHLTRQKTYAERAEEFGAFSGTSEECLIYLRDQCQIQAKSRRQSG